MVPGDQGNLGYTSTHFTMNWVRHSHTQMYTERTEWLGLFSLKQGRVIKACKYRMGLEKGNKRKPFTLLKGPDFKSVDKRTKRIMGQISGVCGEAISWSDVIWNVSGDGGLACVGGVRVQGKIWRGDGELLSGLCKEEVSAPDHNSTTLICRIDDKVEIGMRWVELHLEGVRLAWVRGVKKSRWSMSHLQLEMKRARG